jgi:hypothetical protein
LSNTFPVLNLKIPHSKKPFSSGKTDTIGHPNPKSGAGSMSQVTTHLPNKGKALGSNPNNTKKEKDKISTVDLERGSSSLFFKRGNHTELPNGC